MSTLTTKTKFNWMKVGIASHVANGKPLPAIIAFLLSANMALGQKLITGFVHDSGNQPVAGATIIIKSSAIGTTSDTNGKFSIYAKTGDILIVSSVEMTPSEIRVGSKQSVEVVLSASVNKLDELVVIGYGATKKKDITGSVASVSEKDFNKGIFTSANQLIQGKLAGVQIISNNGQPGGAFSVRVRGYSAVTGSGLPLYVVDGVPLDGRSLQNSADLLNFLNPDDIASIDVLKDASATAIYGSRAAYGVIMINTKKPRLGEAQIEFSASAGVSSILKNTKVLNASQYRNALNYYGVGNSFDLGANDDGMKGILRHAWQQNYTLAIQGGNDNGKYRFSLGYLDQDGIVINTGFKKYTSDIIGNFKFLTNKRLGLDLHINASQFIQDGSFLRDGESELISAALHWDPTAPLKKADGSIRIVPSDDVNPVALSNFSRDNFKCTTILGSVSPYFKFTDWLEYKLLASVNYCTGISRFSLNQVLSNYLFFPPGGFASIDENELLTSQVTQTLNFNKNISHSLRLDATAGYEYMKFTSKGFSLGGSGAPPNGFGNFGIDITNYVQYSDAASRNISSYQDPLVELQSFFGRAIFNYRDRYLVTGTFRADGSTKFGENNKYGYFPSFAAAWNVAKESFFSISAINLLKLRVGWGKTGNQEFPAGSAQALYAFQNNGTVIQINNPNPDLKWQSDRQYDVGLDFSLGGKLTGTLDYYNKKTTHLLFPSAPIQPAPPGTVVRWTNLDGSIVNKGFEILLTGTVIKNNSFNFDLSVNATFLNNSVSGLPAPVPAGSFGTPEIIKNGLPINAFYTRKFLGLEKSTGSSIYQDSGATFYAVGNPNAKVLLGISPGFQYKRFSLTMNIYGSFGQDIYNFSLQSLGVQGIMGSNMALSVYQEPVKESLGNPVTPSSRFVQKGDYLKLANLTVSYKITNMARTIKTAIVYATAQNLFIITPYAGFDPEVNTDNKSSAGVAALGIDNFRYPSARSFIVGIRFSL